MNIVMDEVLKPLVLLRKIYSSNPMLSQYIKLFDSLIEKERTLFESYSGNHSKYQEELIKYKVILEEKCNSNIESNLYDIYNAEINLIKVTLEKLKKSE